MRLYRSPSLRVEALEDRTVPTDLSIVGQITPVQVGFLTIELPVITTPVVTTPAPTQTPTSGAFIGGLIGPGTPGPAPLPAPPTPALLNPGPGPINP